MITLQYQHRSLVVKLFVLLSLIALSCLPLLISGAAARGSNRTDLEQSVIQAVMTHRGTSVADAGALQETIQVNVKREDASKSWVFGSVVIPAPAVEDVMPEGWLFVARETGRGWVTAIDGTPAFSTLVRQAPEAVIGSHERDNLAATGEVGIQATDVEMRLPWALGVSWYLTGGAHSTNYSALDFAGGDQVVRAARSGNVYTMCSNNLGWLRIIHNNGYSSDYYHLWNNIKWADGSAISEGTRVGDTGTDVSCGGSATGRHVHFALRANGSFVTVDNKIIGGWTFHIGSQPYNGCATRGTTTRCPTSLLYNYGH
jgi:LasA protease